MFVWSLNWLMSRKSNFKIHKITTVILHNAGVIIRPLPQFKWSVPPNIPTSWSNGPKCVILTNIFLSIDATLAGQVLLEIGLFPAFCFQLHLPQTKQHVFQLSPLLFRYPQPGRTVKDDFALCKGPIRRRQSSTSRLAGNQRECAVLLET